MLRTLRQDVDGFWDWTKRMARRGEARLELAEAVIGRRKDGKPLDGLPRAEVTGLDDPEDDFTYDSDPEGHICPYGGHIRRANPRTGDIPGGGRGLLHYLLVMLGLWATVKEDVIATSRYHRLLRRGPALRRARARPQGLHFIALNSNLTRHFEFIQNAWLMNPSFAGLANEADPLTGCRAPYPGGTATDTFHPAARGGAVHPLYGPAPLRHRRGRRLFLPAGAEGAEVYRAGVKPLSLQWEGRDQAKHGGGVMEQALSLGSLRDPFPIHGS